MSLKNRVGIRRPNLSEVAKYFLIAGIVLVFYSLTLVIEGYTPVTIDPTKKLNAKLDEPISANIIDPDFPTENDPAKSLKANFDTLTIFQGDRIGVTAKAEGIRSDVKAIAVIVADPSFNVTETGKKLGYEIDIGKKYKNVIELIPNDERSASVRQIIPFLQPHQDIMLHAVVLFQNNKTVTLYSKQILTTVLSKADKLQAISIIQQEQTNKIFIGLGWIGVAIVLILSGVDILLRIRFDSNTHNEDREKYYHKKWHMPFYD